jgi:hypothetical protein
LRFIVDFQKQHVKPCFDRTDFHGLAANILRFSLARAHLIGAASSVLSRDILTYILDGGPEKNQTGKVARIYLLLAF